MMAFLAQSWKLMPTQIQADWSDLATSMNVSPFNAFVAFNMKNWTQWTYPGSYPDFQTLTDDVIGTLTPTGGVRQINLSHVLTTKNRGWGVTYFAGKSANPATARQNAVLTVNTIGLTTGATFKSTITGLTPGSWYVGYVHFPERGTASSAVEDATPVTVT